MPVTFLPFTSFVPDGGAHGSEMSLIENALPLHRGFRPLQKKSSLATVADGPVTGAFVHLYQQSAAVQKGRPSADTSPGSWLPASGAVLFSLVDEQLPDDVDFIYAPGAPSASQVKLALSALNSVAPGANFFLRWRYRVPVAVAGTWTMKAELMEGATVRATDTATGTTTGSSFTQRQYNLTVGEATAISNFANLFVRFTATVPGSTQLERPTSDLSVGSWVTDVGATTNLYTRINESSFSDANYIASPALMAGSSLYTYQAAIGAATDPLARTGLVFRYRYAATNAGVTLKARLRQGSTLLKEIVHTNVGLSFVENDYSLTPTEAAAITDFSALRFEAEASLPASVASTASQFGRPTQDTINSGPFSPAWTNQAGSGSNLWQSIDEPTPAVTTDYVEAIIGGGVTTFTYEAKLTSLVNPLRSSGFTMRTTATIDPSHPTGSNILAMYLYQGATQIAVNVITLTTSYAQYTYNLTASEIASITDYSDLRLRFVWTSNGNIGLVFIAQAELEMPQPSTARVSWMQLDAPSASRGEVSWTEFEIPDPTSVYKGDVPTLIVGTKTKLYAVDQTGFADVSKGGGYGAGSPGPAGWWIRQAGADVVATNYTDPIQYRAGNTGAFADLITSTEKPKARFLDVVRNQLVLADIVLGGATYGTPDGINLSAVDNFRDFHPAASTSSVGARVYSTPGQIMGFVGGDSGTIFKRNSIHSLLFTGDTANPYRVDTISNSHGTPFPRSIVRGVGAIYWWNGDGFARLIEGGYPEPIGNDLLAGYMTDPLFSAGAILNVQPTSYADEDQMMVGVRDPVSGLLLWQYRSVAYSLSGTPYAPAASRHHRVVVLNPATGAFTVLLDPNFNLSYLVQTSNTLNSDNHLLKGTSGFDWDGTNTTWFKWNSGNTYGATFHVKRQAIALDNADHPVDVRITGVMPVFTPLPQGNLPNVSVQGTTSNDPLYIDRSDASGVINPTVQAYLRTDADEQGFYPFMLEGRWFDWNVVVPDLAGGSLSAFKGLYVWWDPRS